MADIHQHPEQLQPNSLEMYYPYPNRNAYRLGDWYWNGGIQKSQSSFKDLVQIIGDPDFSPSDVRDVHWPSINDHLAHDCDEWADEDAGWTKTPVTILVPFQPRRGTQPDHGGGPREFVVDFHHRSLISVIREKLSNQVDNKHFHYEPYELKWQPANVADPISVYGELYESPAFINAHEEIQNSPREPNCDLPRCVIALMFWSDATRLTSFGDTKLWPLYLFFGNESKYRRCKPSCNLACHVAYFETVCQFHPGCALREDWHCH